MTYSDGQFYNGLWLNDHAIVNGQFKYPNGDIYTGQHANGYKEGIGKMVYCTKETCEGEWSDDLFIIGNQTKVDGTICKWKFGSEYK